jgi:hypothetical protein
LKEGNIETSKGLSQSEVLNSDDSDMAISDFMPLEGKSGRHEDFQLYC